MNVACIQLENGPSESRGARVERVRELIVDAADGADLVVLPELWPTGYFSFDRYAADAEPLEGATMSALGALARELGIHLMAGSFVEQSGGALTNCAVTFGPRGDVLHTYRKIHLFGYGSEESRLLTPGKDVMVATTEIGQLATSTCYDLRFPELYRLLMDAGAEIVIVPAAWPDARLRHWRLLLQARAVENQMFVIGCNGAGTQAGVPLAGHSMIVDPWGDVVAQAGAAEEILRAEITVARVAEVRQEFPVLRHRRLGIPAPALGIPAPTGAT